MKLSTFITIGDKPQGMAEVELSNPLLNTILGLRKEIADIECSGADIASRPDFSPNLRFYDPETRVENLALLVVNPTSFWWEGYLLASEARWKTNPIPISMAM
jgi:hypothetical protein